jgi:hypothetical protein
MLLWILVGVVVSSHPSSTMHHGMKEEGYNNCLFARKVLTCHFFWECLNRNLRDSNAAPDTYVHVRVSERTEAFISDMYVLYHPEFDSTEETATMTSEAIYCSEPPNVFIYHEETKDDIPKN